MSDNMRAKFGELMQLPMDFSISESKNKLIDTYLYVNGELCHLLQITGSSIIVQSRNCMDHTVLHGDAIKSLRFYLPLCGVYYMENCYIILHRNARRQWRKSFSWSFYNTNIGEVDTYGLEKAPRMEYYQKGTTLYYYDIAIGKQVGPHEFKPMRKGFDYEIEFYRKLINETV